jgi:hypothetical protein
MLYFAGIIITFFLAIILLTKKGKSAADLVLACWLSIIGIHLFLFYLHITGELFNHPYLLGIQIPMPLLQGPLLYIYVLSVTRSKVFSKAHLLHFIPFIIAHAFLLKFYLLTDAEKMAVYQN